jgi:hypothetical protein
LMPFGRQRRPRMRPSTLESMWQITCGFMRAVPFLKASRGRP